MGKFASETTVSPEKSMMDIMDVLRRYNANKTVYGYDENVISVVFEMGGRRVRFVAPLPKESDAMVKINNSRATKFSQSAYDQKVRSLWRALLLTIKAKLESVESGIETFEDAFMAQLVLPDGQTIGEWARPQIDQIYLSGKMPPMLVAGKSDA